MFYYVGEREENSRNSLGKYCGGIYFWFYTSIPKLVTIPFASQSTGRWKYSYPAHLRCSYQAEVNYRVFLFADYKALFKASNF